MSRAELEQERAYLSTPGYFGFAEQKDYALTKLLERNRQLDAVLEYIGQMEQSKDVVIVLMAADLHTAIESA